MQNVTLISLFFHTMILSLLKIKRHKNINISTYQFNTSKVFRILNI